MQDATVVVNYDLPLAADQLFQRVGRVVRMADDPDRIVMVYTFWPKYDTGIPALKDRVQKLKEMMSSRHDKATDIVAGSILPQDLDPLIVPMACREDIAKLMARFPMPETSLVEEDSPSDSHYALYDRHKSEVKQLGFALRSAKTIGSSQRKPGIPGFRTSQAHIALFFQVQIAFRCLLYNLEAKQIVVDDSVAKSEGILDLLKCDETEPKATVSAKLVESSIIEAMLAWKSAHQHDGSQEINREDVGHACICAVYLDPKKQQQSDLSGIIVEPTVS